MKGEHRAATSSRERCPVTVRSSRKRISKPLQSYTGERSSLPAALRDSCSLSSNLHRQAAPSSLKIAVNTHCLQCEFDRLPAEPDFFFLFLEPAVKL